jgi:hypothetical protein
MVTTQRDEKVEIKNTTGVEPMVFISEILVA